MRRGAARSTTPQDYAAARRCAGRPAAAARPRSACLRGATTAPCGTGIRHRRARSPAPHRAARAHSRPCPRQPCAPGRSGGRCRRAVAPCACRRRARRHRSGDPCAPCDRRASAPRRRSPSRRARPRPSRCPRARPGAPAARRRGCRPGRAARGRARTCPSRSSAFDEAKKLRTVSAERFSSHSALSARLRSIVAFGQLGLSAMKAARRLKPASFSSLRRIVHSTSLRASGSEIVCWIVLASVVLPRRTRSSACFVSATSAAGVALLSVAASGATGSEARRAGGV